MKSYSICTSLVSMKCASQEKARGGGGWWEIPPTMRGAGGWTTMVAAVAAALCLQSAPPLPPATRNARTAAAVVTEVEWTSSCVAEEPKGGSAANLSDPLGVWAYAGTWPHKYAARRPGDRQAPALTLQHTHTHTHTTHSLSLPLAPGAWAPLGYFFKKPVVCCNLALSIKKKSRVVAVV